VDTIICLVLQLSPYLDLVLCRLYAVPLSLLKAAIANHIYHIYRIYHICHIYHIYRIYHIYHIYLLLWRCFVLQTHSPTACILMAVPTLGSCW
jgi:hypothetical protein